MKPTCFFLTLPQSILFFNAQELIETIPEAVLFHLWVCINHQEPMGFGSCKLVHSEELFSRYNIGKMLIQLIELFLVRGQEHNVNGAIQSYGSR